MKSAIRHPQSQIGFSLVELLVVVAIIAILLSLLTPAMDKAIYRAELTVCAAQLRGIGAAAIGYASEQKRYYPLRSPNSGVDAMQIKTKAFNIPGALVRYISADQFVDPFLAGAKLRVDECMNDPNGIYMPGYQVYMDWGGGTTGIRRMRKLGQPMIFNAPEGDVRIFNVLLGDRDARQPASWTTNNHPDRDGLQTLWKYQSGGNPWLSPANGEQVAALIGPQAGAAAGNVYVTWWLGRPKRGLLDNNYAMDDGSVLQLDDVPIMYTLDDDERLTFLPDVTDMTKYAADRKAQVPGRNG